MSISEFYPIPGESWRSPIERGDRSNNSRYEVIEMSPGGNNTALVRSQFVPLSLDKKIINDALIQNGNAIEQVGFMTISDGALRLDMAGGEFCGNATRSAAYLSLNGEPGELEMSVSGVSEKIRAGVTSSGDAYARVPVNLSLEQITVTDKGLIVPMEGITHYVIQGNADSNDPEEKKQQAMSLLKAQGLSKGPAAGVIWANNDVIDPVVYVRDVDTCFNETACGSGTMALAIARISANQKIDGPMRVQQPSGGFIDVSVEVEDNIVRYATISGPVENLGTGALRQLKNGEKSYIFDVNAKSIEQLLKEGTLPNLYQDVFSKPPYNEVFTLEEVNNFFRGYSENGIVKIAKVGGLVSGFAATIPLGIQTDVLELMRKNGYPSDIAYFAELGVRDDMRRKGLGQQLVQESMLDVSGDIVLRTQENNVGAIKLYGRMGFTQIPDVTQSVSDTDIRIFMIKNGN